MMTTGYAGYYGTPGFQNKADALKYAMELSYRIDENGGYFLDKAYALNIYNFIIENVELPNTKEENMATFLKTAENVLNEMKKTTEKKKK